MPYRDKRGGSLKIDIRTDSVGRIHRHTGFQRQSQVTKVKAIVRKLDEDAQTEVLEAVKSGDITCHQLIDADRAGKLTGSELLTMVRLREPLWDAIVRMLPSMADGETRRRYKTSLDKLKRLGLPVIGRDDRLTVKAKVGHLAKTFVEKRRVSVLTDVQQRVGFRSCALTGGDSCLIQ